ncbi:MAG: hypothetical protein ACRDP7_30295, partial [Trebonia sp.]
MSGFQVESESLAHGTTDVTCPTGQDAISAGYLLESGATAPITGIVPDIGGSGFTFTSAYAADTVTGYVSCVNAG